jgi:hypothetical protein
MAACSEWVLPSRRGFSSFVTEKLAPKTRPSAGTTLLPHQTFVAGYLHPDSPYRGLLLYHGLGTGKTCASIAAAQGALAANRRVWVLVPASLRKNFEQEVITCGGPEFSLDREWSVSQGGEVRVNDTGTPNYTYLSRTDQSRVRDWLSLRVRQRYSIVGYNGLTAKGLDKLTEDHTVNPFDNSLVIIDEVHNLTRTLSNATQQKTRSKNVKFALYDLLLAANGTKVVALSGSPAINHPFEFAFLVNILRGRLQEYVFKWPGALTAVEIADARERLHACPVVDTCRVTAAGATLTTCPPGFRFTSRSQGLVVRTRGGAKAALLAAVKGVRGVSTKHLGIKVFEPLPTDASEFNKLFVDAVNGDILRPTVLIRRMRGIVSFYDVRDTTLYPVVNNKTITVTMSALQYTEYERARAKERQMEDRAAKAAAGEEVPTVHRGYSRPVLNFVFPTADGIAKLTRREHLLRQDEDMGAEEHKRLFEEDSDKAFAALKAHRLWKSDTQLAQHSPKFASIYTSMEACGGKVMVFSIFRRLEGAGLMMALLRARGWRHVTLKSQGAGHFVCHVEDSLTGRPDAPKFILPVPNSEEGTLLLKIFNGKLSALPEALRASVAAELGSSDNARGDLIKTLLLTKSGAEGLSLLSVREVHIMEPYWNTALIEQVKGRAVRLRSHMQLPPEDRVVDIYTYICTFSDTQRADPKFKRTLDRDGGLTSDEELARKAAAKDRQLGQLLALVRDTSVDCAMHATAHNKDHPSNVRCYEPPAMFDIRPMMPASVIADGEDPPRILKVNGPTGPIEVVIPWRSTKAYDREAYDKGTRVAVARVSDDATQLVWIKRGRHLQ